jgi:transposase-like protein
MAYAERLPSQHPNATDAEKVLQAMEILDRLADGESTRSIARAMDINRSTLYARLEMINQPLPSAQAVRVIHFERLEAIYEGLEGRVGDVESTSNTDYARLRAEQLRVLLRQSQLLGVESTSTAPRPPDEPAEIEDDYWEEAEGVGAG